MQATFNWSGVNPALRPASRYKSIKARQDQRMNVITFLLLEVQK
jgi:hypothetical protein